jgi:hypothetical protein
MIDTIGRARIIGALVLLLAFGAGVAVGHYWLPNEPPNGIMISMKATDAIPAELTKLDLTDSQETQIRLFLHQGTERVGRVMHQFMGPIDAAVDSTDQQIRSVLTAEQIRMLDQIRKEHPLKQMRERKVIDTVR